LVELDPRDPLVREENVVRTDPPELLDPQECLASLVLQVCKDLLVKKANMVRRVLKDIVVLLVYKACLVQQDLQETKDLLEITELTAKMEKLVLGVHLVLMATSVQPV
jgi:hypothetical protein